MMKFFSPVQIWKDKKNPTKIFQSGKIRFEFLYTNSCYYLKKSDLIALLTPCYHQKQNYYDLPYVLLDFSENKFTILNYPNFDLKEIDEDIIQLNLHFRYHHNEETKERIAKNDGVTIDLRKQEWWAIDTQSNLCEQLTEVVS